MRQRTNRLKVALIEQTKTEKRRMGTLNVNPAIILDLLLSVIAVSVKTADILKRLLEVKFNNPKIR